MMKPSTRPTLSRRERQIMDILYRRGRSTAGEVMRELSGDPHYSTVRTQLRVLEEKGYVSHKEEKLRYVYVPAIPQSEVKHTALRQLIDTFYDGSTENVVAALLGIEGSRLSQKKLDRIAEMVEKARKGARR
jgi:predicted transcriptional regulator